MSSLRQHWPMIALALFALTSGLWLWWLRDEAPPPTLVGPPRSDYRLENFELVALDEHGRESFAARGPRLERHPFLGTLDVEQPRLAFPDRHGARWQSRAERAWVSRDAAEVRLLGDVQVAGPPDDGEPLRLHSDRLTVFPRQREVVTDAVVTVTEPGSILRGRGMRADLDARRVQLLSEVSIHHEPSRR